MPWKRISRKLSPLKNYLRGTIAEDLNDGLTGGFKGDNFLLIRFHGMYQQDDRDIRAERAAQKLSLPSTTKGPGCFSLISRHLADNGAQRAAHLKIRPPLRRPSRRIRQSLPVRCFALDQ